MTSLPVYLPSGFKPNVKVGDQVGVGNVIARREVVENVQINLSDAFSLNPRNVKKYLKKNPGDSISSGEVIASRSKLLGMQEEKILSHVNGTIASFDRNSGSVKIILHDDDEAITSTHDEEILSPVDGEIELCDNDVSDSKASAGRILIKTSKNILAGLMGIGEEVEAEVYLLEEEKKHPEEVVVQLHHLDTKIIGKILLGGVFDRDVLIKAIGMGAKGIIGVRIREEDISYINERRLGAPIIAVDSKDLPKLIKWNGKKVFMNGDMKTILFLQK